MDILGKRIRYSRERNSLSQKSFAEKIGITNAVLSRYELGERKPDPEMLKNIADCLDVSTDYLLGRTDNPGSGFSEEDMMDPELDMMFKEMKEDSERREQLKKIWRIIKNEDNQK